MPRDTFDPQAVLEIAGRDPQALAEWVRKNTTWAPYQGALRGPAPGQGPHFDPHEIAVGKDGAIFTAEVLGWRAQKFRLQH